MSFCRYARPRPFDIERLLMLRGFILTVHMLLALMIIVARAHAARQGRGGGRRIRLGRVGHRVRCARHGTLFSKLTAVFAAMFFMTSLTLAYMGARPTARADQRASSARRRPRRVRAVGAPPAQTHRRRRRPCRSSRPRLRPRNRRRRSTSSSFCFRVEHCRRGEIGRRASLRG